MNELYAGRNGIPVNNKKPTKATRAVDKLVERDKQNRERSAQIIGYYTSQKQKDLM